MPIQPQNYERMNWVTSPRFQRANRQHFKKLFSKQTHRKRELSKVFLKSGTVRGGPGGDLIFLLLEQNDAGHKRKFMLRLSAFGELCYKPICLFF